MRRRILCGLASLLLLFTPFAPPACAQKLTDRLNPQAAAADENKGRGPPALQYTVASLSAIVVLVILCMPSRKRTVG